MLVDAQDSVQVCGIIRELSRQALREWFTPLDRRCAQRREGRFTLPNETSRDQVVRAQQGSIYKQTGADFGSSFLCSGTYCRQ